MHQNKSLLVMAKELKIKLVDLKKVLKSLGANVTVEQIVQGLDLIASADNKQFELFETRLYVHRVKAKNKAITRITRTSQHANAILEAVRLANEFCETYGLPTLEGYDTFITLSLQEMGVKFYPSKLVSNAQKVFFKYEDLQLIGKDADPKGTKEVVDIYLALMKKLLGRAEKYTTQDTAYADFIRARGKIEELNAEVFDYIAAQIDGLSFMNEFPAPYQLHTENAEKRYREYMKSLAMKAKSDIPQAVSFDDEEEMYFKRLQML